MITKQYINLEHVSASRCSVSDILTIARKQTGNNDLGPDDLLIETELKTRRIYFYVIIKTPQQFLIYVNNKEYEIPKGELLFNEIVDLAFPHEYRNRKHIRYSDCSVYCDPTIDRPYGSHWVDKNEKVKLEDNKQFEVGIIPTD